MATPIRISTTHLLLDAYLPNVPLSRSQSQPQRSRARRAGVVTRARVILSLIAAILTISHLNTASAFVTPKVQSCPELGGWGISSSGAGATTLNFRSRTARQVNAAPMTLLGKFSFALPSNAYAGSVKCNTATEGSATVALTIYSRDESLGAASEPGVTCDQAGIVSMVGEEFNETTGKARSAQMIYTVLRSSPDPGGYRIPGESDRGQCASMVGRTEELTVVFTDDGLRLLGEITETCNDYSHCGSAEHSSQTALDIMVIKGRALATVTSANEGE